MQLWTITRISTGEVLYAAFATPSEGSHPKDNGWAWDASTQKATRIDKTPDQTSQKWSGAAWIDDLDKIRAQMLAGVKAEAEARKMAMMTPGGAKKTEYDAKRAEVLAWDGLGGTVTAILLAFNGLTSARRLTMFAYAIADAAAFGDQPADAIARFRAGMTAGTKVHAIAAVEAKACAAIKAATTPATARAAVTPSAISWPA